MKATARIAILVSCLFLTDALPVGGKHRSLKMMKRRQIPNQYGRRGAGSRASYFSGQSSYDGSGAYRNPWPAPAPTLNAETKAPTGNWYEFTTPPVNFPTMDAQTDYPDFTNSPTFESTPASTTASTEVPTHMPPAYASSSPFPTTTLFPKYSPTIAFASTTSSAPTTTTAPSSSTSISLEPTTTTTPSISPTISNVPTMTAAPSSAPSPSLMPVLNAETQPPADNSEALCKSNNGSFFIHPETQGTLSSFVYDLQVYSFEYEVETIPGTSVKDVLPGLEHAFIDRLLPDLFASSCAMPAKVRRLSEVSIVGLSAVPDDEITDLGCSTKKNDANNCKVVKGKLSIFTDGGDSTLAVQVVAAVLKEAMGHGDFNQESKGIVGVSYREENSNGGGSNQDGLTNGQNDTMSPTGDTSHNLRIGLTTLSAAGVVLVALGASFYQRRRHLRENDASTLQEGATLNGLSRFDAPAQDTHDDDIDITPLSPSAKSSCTNRFTSSFYEL